MAYRYSPCGGNCCGCNAANTFLRIYVSDSCLSSLIPLVGATVTITLSGNPIASGATDSFGFFSTPISKTGTYSVVVNKTGYTTSTPLNVVVTTANCGATVNRSIVLVRNRVFTVSSTVNLNCGSDFLTGVTATLSQPGSTTVSATADSSGNLLFTGVFLTGVTVTMVVSVNNAMYTPSTQTQTDVFGSGNICNGASITGVTWQGRTCPGVTSSQGSAQTPPNLVTGNMCVPAASTNCGQPYHVGDLTINDPSVGGGSLTYLDCYSFFSPFEGSWWGPVWRGTLTYNSPGCSITCTVGGSPCTVSFPATTATITYTVGFSRLTSPSDQFALSVTYKYRDKNCLLGGGCDIRQIADTGYLDLTQNPPTGRFWPISGGVGGPIPFSSATCPPGWVVAFNAGPLSVSSTIPCTNTNPSRTITVTA